MMLKDSGARGRLPDTARSQQGRYLSGGFNIYPSGIEAELRHEAVVEAAVVGVASGRWGETPVAFVALRQGAIIDGPVLMDWVNTRLGKTQRVSALSIVDSLPRSPIGKVLRRELRDLYAHRGADGSW